MAGALMTYLQWRSLGGLARPSKNSCKIPQNNGGLVAAAAVAVAAVAGEQGGWICGS